MSTKWTPAGQTSDFAVDPNISLMLLVKDNWFQAAVTPNDTPKAAEILFGTTWWTERQYYQIHIRVGNQDTRPHIIGWTRHRYLDNHEIHLWAKGHNPKDSDRISGKDKKWLLEKEVARLLTLNQVDPFTGVTLLRFVGPREAPQNTEDHRQEIFHSIFNVELYYHKVQQ